MGELIERSFAMFSEDGNKSVATMVESILSRAEDMSDAAIYRELTQSMNKIAAVHGEVWDTAVREAIIGTIERRTGREMTIHF